MQVYIYYKRGRDTSGGVITLSREGAINHAREYLGQCEKFKDMTALRELGIDWSVPDEIFIRTFDNGNNSQETIFTPETGLVE